MSFFIRVLNHAFDIMQLFVVAYVFMSWFRVDQRNVIVKFINKIVEPILSKIRSKLPRTGMIDLSPLILILGLELIRGLIYSLLS